MANARLAQYGIDWSFHSIRRAHPDENAPSSEVRRVYKAGLRYIEDGKAGSFEEAMEIALAIPAKKTLSCEVKIEPSQAPNTAGRVYLVNGGASKNELDEPGASCNDELFSVGSLFRNLALPVTHLFSLLMLLLKFIWGIVSPWVRLVKVFLSSPRSLATLAFVGLITVTLVQLQAEFYAASEGKSYFQAVTIALICEVSLIVLALARPKSYSLKIASGIVLGLLFVYVGSCLGLTVWQDTTKRRIDVQANVLDVSEERRLLKSVEDARSAQKKVRSVDGAGVKLKALRAVQSAETALNSYRSRFKRTEAGLAKINDSNLIIQGALLIMLRILLMALNAVVSHYLREIWDEEVLARAS